MKKIGLVVALSAALGLASPVALAESTPSFDFVSGAYVNLDADGTHVGGAQFDFSQTFDDNWFGYGFVRNLSKGDVDNTSAAAGVGYRHYTSGSTALYGILGLAYDKIGVGNLSESDTGLAVNAGVRHSLSESFEIDAYIQHVNIWDDSGESYTVSGKYYFGPTMAFQVGYTHGDSDVSMTFVGFSYNFKRN